MSNYESNQSTIFNIFAPLNNYKNSIFSFANYTDSSDYNTFWDFYSLLHTQDQYYPGEVYPGDTFPSVMYLDDYHQVRRQTTIDFIPSGQFQSAVGYSDYSSFFFLENAFRTVSLLQNLFIFFFIAFLLFFVSTTLRTLLVSRSNFLQTFKLNKIIKQSILLNMSYVTNADVVSSFFLIFVSVYFLEIHWFFFNLFELTSDSTAYTFNFLLSGFLFVFLYKFIFTSFSTNTFLVVNSVLSNMYYMFKLDYTNKIYSKKSVKRTLSVNYFVLFKHFIFFKLNLMIFFFLSTFLVWALRYVIQFVRLAVLFLIHTIFELIVFSYDQYLISWALNVLTLPNYVFFAFFYFGLFLYFILYLNLMLSLQIFIFFFFTETFQQNFAVDLSVTVKSNFLKK